MYEDSLDKISKMFVNRSNKNATLRCVNKSCVNNHKNNKKHDKNSIRISLPRNNLNFLTFAMLLKRTTFTIVLIFLTISLQISNVSCSNSLEISATTPKYIPLDSTKSVRNELHRTTILTPVTESFKEFHVHNIPEDVTPRSYSNQTFDTGNKLWDGLLNECMKRPSLSCIQKNVYSFLDDGFMISGDLNITDGIVFKQNELAHWKYSEQANVKSDEKPNEEEDLSENEIEYDEPRFADSPIEEITDALYGKSMNFLMRHDLELKLPEIMFNGATLKISPRSLEGDGAIVKLDLIPKEQSEGRILFKKIKKFIKNKILLAVLVIVVIIKVIKLKLFVFLPLLMGIHNAKKLFLKLVLFVFPALGQIFKLCSWYHNNYHQTKYHHHHHQISHLHHSVPHHPTVSYGPPSFEAPHPVYGLPSSSGLSPPSHESGSYFGTEDHDWSATGNVPDYIAAGINRNSIVDFNPKPEDSNIINSWGLGNYGQSATSPTQSAQGYTRPSPYFAQQPDVSKKQYVAPTNQNPSLVYATARRPTVNPTAQAEKEALMKAAQKQAERLAQAQISQQLQQKLQQKATLNSAISSVAENFKASPVFDPFYSTILQKVDQVFVGLSFFNEPCRERLICSMYKNPVRFSPHSNLISNELSRESSELQKPAPNSIDAARFYRYVQAARDGQENKDCLKLYPHCSVDTERKKK